MVDVFRAVVEKLIDLGFYNFFFPWLITSAILYGLLRRAKVLGDSIVLNGIVALSIAFLIFGFPVMVGFNLQMPFSIFFTQATTVILFIFIGLILASLFYPNLLDFLPKVFVRRTALWAMIAIGIALFVTSGFVQILWSPSNIPPGPGEARTPTDVLLIAAGLIIFIVLLLIASAVAVGEKE